METPELILNDYSKTDPTKETSFTSISASLTSEYIIITDDMINTAQQQNTIISSENITETHEHEPILHSDDDTASLPLHVERTAAREHHYGSTESLERYLKFSDVTSAPTHSS